MTTRRCALVAAALALTAPGAWAGAGGLPDLRALIDDAFHPSTVTAVERNASVDPEDVAEGCAGGLDGRTLVHFTLSTFNEGTADLILGDPGCPDCELDPDPTCTNELFECSPLAGHGHPHFARYGLYELLPSADALAAATGHKQGFCLEDTICDNKVYNCFNQGLSLGCKDVYPARVLGCQYVDATGLPGGRYLLRATVNYERILEESNYDNNVAERSVDVCEGTAGPRVRYRVPKSTPDRWRWKIVGRSVVQLPLVDVDPFKDGAWLRIEADGISIVDVELPGRPGSGHCGPKDGWKRDGDSPAPHYENESGFVDRDCQVSADGLRRFRAVVKRNASGTEAKLRYAISGTSPLPAPAERLRATVGLGIETGSCWTGAARCDGLKKCTGTSADGAFVD